MTQNEINDAIKQLVLKMQELLAMVPDDVPPTIIDIAEKDSEYVSCDSNSDSGYPGDYWSSY